MWLYNNIPEFGQFLQRFNRLISDGKAVNVAMFIVLSFVNLIFVAAAVFLLPVGWHTTLPLFVVALLWNAFWGMSICRQIAVDQVDIGKSRVLFRRFQNTTKYFESMLQDTSDMIISLDKEYLIFKFNIGAQKLLGYSQAEILGKPFEKLFLNPEDKNKMYLSDDSRETRIANTEIPMKTSTGETIIASMGMSKMRDGGFVVTAQDITEKKKLEEILEQQRNELNRLAITDDLTGLYNSRYFYVVIKGELSRVKRHPDRKLSLLYMDVDKFKEYNDTEGHLMGDSVLKALGDVIIDTLRKDIDAGFRYGGDEFVVILPDTDMHQAHTAAERILENFCNLGLGNTSLSIGIAEARYDDEEKTIVKRADAAMYASKRSGGRCITLSGEK